jgi:hypothetical protein
MEGLVRGAALALGLVLAMLGFLLVLSNGDTSTAGFPDGTAHGTTVLGLEANRWTAWFTLFAGALLLIGATRDALACSASLVAGLALSIGAVMAAVDGNDLLGLAATNGATELVWGVAGVAMLVNAMLPQIAEELALRERSRPSRARSLVS